MKRDLTAEDVQALYDKLLTAYNAVRIDRNTKDGLQKIRDFLKNNLGVTADIDAYLENYAFTLGAMIYFPFEPGVVPREGSSWTLLQQAMVLAHELTHVEQFQKEGMDFIWNYSTSTEARAAYEAQAYGCQLELLPALTGMYYTPTEVASLLADYGCHGADIELVAHMLTDRMDAVKEGGVVNSASWAVLQFLTARGVV